MADRQDLYNNVTHQLIQRLKDSVQMKSVNIYNKIKTILNDRLW